MRSANSEGNCYRLVTYPTCHALVLKNSRNPILIGQRYRSHRGVVRCHYLFFAAFPKGGVTVITRRMTATEHTRVLIVDDHRIVRLGLRRLLESTNSHIVVGEAGSGKEALETLPDARPDLAIVDISMDGMDGIELTERIKEEHPGVRVLIVSMHGESYYVRQALGVGADGYVLKDNIDSVLKEATDAVLGGERYLCEDSRKLVGG